MKHAALTRQSAVEAITTALRETLPHLADRALDGATDLSLDLGVESMRRAEVLLRVEQRLGVDIELDAELVGAAVTIDDLADRIVATCRRDTPAGADAAASRPPERKE
ncbi:phosphopantetheine-binding protein [Streptomyces sp. NPDC049099]|uniref:phosphopantetheine-binding protein n=1 Tax=Streptomyces sp. NPDC049099 TaxID=3155768 RepID=UPI00342A67C8